ncbi:uncharacterized protein LOC112175172 isoform X2 [Rosa chinensis]|uniref:uncharacterized protein LOC112175172 isoform X2 n=1 Tax=Rosa chinensis TaxID=74649 RepID=UPI000D08D763|nr:uncharacterized protein LOC112175172 isoform X2 [Rosa chinensis]
MVLSSQKPHRSRGWNPKPEHSNPTALNCAVSDSLRDSVCRSPQSLTLRLRLSGLPSPSLRLRAPARLGLLNATMADVATQSCSRCSKPANLQCPKCVELKLPREDAAFCTQDCFKASWSLHKSVHLKAKQSNRAGNPENEGWQYCMKKGQGRTPKLPYFDWTGTLRPYPISSKCVVPSHIDLPDWAADGIPKEEPSSDLQRVIEIKTPDQIERMRETCRKKIGFQFTEAECLKIDVKEKKVYCQSNLENGEKEILVDYDYLVIFVGANVNTFNTPGVMENCHFLKEVEDAQKIRRTVIECFEKASLPTVNDEEKEKILHFAVV